MNRSTNVLMADIYSKSIVTSEYYNNRMLISDKIIKKWAKKGREVRLSKDGTLDWVCKFFGKKKEDVIGNALMDSITVKHIAALLLYQQHNMTTSQIASVLGLRNHSSVLNYFVNMSEDKLIYNKRLHNKWKSVKMDLNIKWSFSYETKRKRDIA